MREIEFRGKLTSGKGWAFGNLRVLRGYEIITPDDTLIGRYGAVDPETVGQYTGLKDRNETRIFEGDILIVNSSYHGLDEENGPAIVNWSEEDCKWVIGYPGLQFDLGSFYSAQLETVGNIYDNPELLEVQH